IIKVFAVPKSNAISSVKKSKNPIFYSVGLKGLKAVFNKCKKLMFKMSYSGKYHRHFMCIAIVDAQVVFNGAAGLNYRSNPCIVGNLHTVRKRKKGIAGHHRPFQIELKTMRLLNGLLECIYAARLPRSASHELSSFS